MFRTTALLGVVGVGGAAAVAAGAAVSSAEAAAADKPKIVDLVALRKDYDETAVPAREEMIHNMRVTKNYDVLVIGGGATGTGIALDAQLRGLRVAIVDRDDFAAGTSSRSTKLIHGGVRYLENAFKKLDISQFKLVFEALHERTTFLEVAPHLSKPLPIMTPCYKWWEVPYYWAGLKVYDLIAGSHKLFGLSSHYVSASESRRLFPMLKRDGLVGSVVYYDGQMNDARMCLTLALTAAVRGADVANYTEVEDLIKNADGKVVGARVRDRLAALEHPGSKQAEAFEVRAKVVVNACGPFVDSIRHMADPEAPDIIIPSAGVHIVLPDFYTPQDIGLVVPKTTDGRVVFMLPWESYSVAGTTDSETELTMRPTAAGEDVDFILEELSKYLELPVHRDDTLAAWAGIRPLARDLNAKDTASISRDHVIIAEPYGMVTITGGKWTTYRNMAEECVDKVLEVRPDLAARAAPCSTATTKLLGAEMYDPAMYTVATQEMIRHDGFRKGSITTDIAMHLCHSYGDRAFLVGDYASTGWGKKIASGYPFLEAEIVYGVKNEWAVTVVDVLARRTRLAYLHAAAARTAVPRVAEIMATYLEWSEEEKARQIADAYDFIETMTPANVPPTAGQAPTEE